MLYYCSTAYSHTHTHTHTLTAEFRLGCPFYPEESGFVTGHPAWKWLVHTHTHTHTHTHSQQNLVWVVLFTQTLPKRFCHESF